MAKAGGFNVQRSVWYSETKDCTIKQLQLGWSWRRSKKNCSIKNYEKNTQELEKRHNKKLARKPHLQKQINFTEQKLNSWTFWVLYNVLQKVRTTFPKKQMANRNYLESYSMDMRWRDAKLKEKTYNVIIELACRDCYPCIPLNTNNNGRSHTGLRATLIQKKQSIKTDSTIKATSNWHKDVVHNLTISISRLAHFGK